MAIQSLIGMGKRWWPSTEDSRPSYKISHLDMLVSMNTQDLKLLRILFVEHYKQLLLVIRSISSIRYTE